MWKHPACTIVRGGAQGVLTSPQRWAPLLVLGLLEPDGEISGFSKPPIVSMGFWTPKQGLPSHHVPWRRCGGSSAPPPLTRSGARPWAQSRAGWGPRPGGGCGRARCRSPATAAASAPAGCHLCCPRSLRKQSPSTRGTRRRRGGDGGHSPRPKKWVEGARDTQQAPSGHLLPAPRLPLHHPQREGLKRSKILFLSKIQVWTSSKIQMWSRDRALTDSISGPALGSPAVSFQC